MNDETYVEHLGRTESEGKPVDVLNMLLHQEINKKFIKEELNMPNGKPIVLINGKNIFDECNKNDITINGVTFKCYGNSTHNWRTIVSYKYLVVPKSSIFLEFYYNPKYKEFEEEAFVTICFVSDKIDVDIPINKDCSKKLTFNIDNDKIVQDAISDFMEVFYTDINVIINEYLNIKEAVTIRLKEFNK